MMQPKRLRRWAVGLTSALALVSGCRTTANPPPDRPNTYLPAAATPAVAQTPPGKHAIRVSQYVFQSDFPIDADAPILHELSDLRETVYRQLRLPSANTLIQVYVFENRERYEKFMQTRYPELPRRRAFFIAQPRAVGANDDLLVYTFWGDHIRQDLRHELTHALLHCVLKDVPLWLDEGLAEYYELPPEQRGINAQHIATLKANFTPDLSRLEQMNQVAQMAPAEYREAWAWVHWMLHSSEASQQALLSYLQQLRATATPGLLQPRLAAVTDNPNLALAHHLAALESQ
jgi:hypothetical protein